MEVQVYGKSAETIFSKKELLGCMSQFKNLSSQSILGRNAILLKDPSLKEAWRKTHNHCLKLLTEANHPTSYIQNLKESQESEIQGVLKRLRIVLGGLVGVARRLSPNNTIMVGPISPCSLAKEIQAFNEHFYCWQNIVEYQLSNNSSHRIHEMHRSLEKIESMLKSIWDVERV